MSWHFSRALVAAYSEACCSDTLLSAPSNRTHTHGMFWSPDKTTEAWTRSRSGMTYAPLTADRGEALLTWFREAFRARTSAQPVKAQESPAAGQGFGQKWHELSVKYNPDTCGWRTLHCLFPEELEWSSVTFPRWGMMRNGELWERTTPAHLTSVTECGLWLTPSVEDGKRNGSAAAWMEYEQTGRTTCARLRNQVAMWPTPKSRDWKDTGTVPPSRQIDSGKDTLGQRLARTEPGSLNPDWVELLMGWPKGWTRTPGTTHGKKERPALQKTSQTGQTVCAASATVKSPRQCDSHGEHCLLTSAVPK